MGGDNFLRIKKNPLNMFSPFSRPSIPIFYVGLLIICILHERRDLDFWHGSIPHCHYTYINLHIYICIYVCVCILEQ